MLKMSNMSVKALQMKGLLFLVLLMILIYCGLMGASGFNFSNLKGVEELKGFDFFIAKYYFNIIKDTYFAHMITFYLFIFPIIPIKSKYWGTSNAIELSLSLPVSSKEYVNKRFSILFIGSGLLIIIFYIFTLIGLNNDKFILASEEKLLYIKSL